MEGHKRIALTTALLLALQIPSASPLVPAETPAAQVDEAELLTAYGRFDADYQRETGEIYTIPVDVEVQHQLGEEPEFQCPFVHQGNPLVGCRLVAATWQRQ